MVTVAPPGTTPRSPIAVRLGFRVGRARRVAGCHHDIMVTMTVTASDRLGDTQCHRDGHGHGSDTADRVGDGAAREPIVASAENEGLLPHHCNGAYFGSICDYSNPCLE